MEPIYTEDKKFEQIDFTENALPVGKYENCSFINCNFSNANFSDIKFSLSEFIGCNLSLVTLARTAFRGIKFKDCKMVGLAFDQCNPFGLEISFDHCSLNHASFYQGKLKKTIFKNSSLLEVDFTECDLSHSIFDNCDFTMAIFENTLIEKADLRTSINYSINPEINKIKKAKFSLSGIAGLLDKYNIEIDSTK